MGGYTDRVKIGKKGMKLAIPGLISAHTPRPKCLSMSMPKMSMYKADHSKCSVGEKAVQIARQARIEVHPCSGKGPSSTRAPALLIGRRGLLRLRRDIWAHQCRTTHFPPPPEQFTSVFSGFVFMGDREAHFLPGSVSCKQSLLKRH